jgi:hypothetical protein
LEGNDNNGDGLCILSMNMEIEEKVLNVTPLVDYKKKS